MTWNSVLAMRSTKDDASHRLFAEGDLRNRCLKSRRHHLKVVLSWSYGLENVFPDGVRLCFFERLSLSVKKNDTARSQSPSAFIVDLALDATLGKRRLG